MHHVEVSPLLQVLVVVLLVAAAVQLARIARWRGRLVLLAVVVLCALANPGRARHVRALEKTAPGSDARMLDESVEYHDFLVLSAASIRGRLVSVGGFDRIVAGPISCATLSRISSKTAAPRVRCVR